jgi:hypothetical protein
MPKYDVFQARTHGFYQQVEANSIEEAIELAEEIGDWEQDSNDIEEEVTARLAESEDER